jgi:hypothetical protein
MAYYTVVFSFNLALSLFKPMLMLIGLVTHSIAGPPLDMWYSWVSKKQCTVSWYSTEAEYRSLASATAEVFWIRMVLKDLGIFILDPPLLWCDNLFALALASNLVFHSHTKHIEVDYHFVKEKVVHRDVVVKFISTTDQLADILTKSLPSSSFSRLRDNLLLPFRPPSLAGGYKSIREAGISNISLNT